MGNHHAPLAALGPIDWEDLPQDDLRSFLNETFADSQIIIDSVPSPTPITNAAAFRTELTESEAASRDYSSSNPSSASSYEQAQLLRKEWKEVKVNPRDNPLGILVHKLASKDSKGSWFARQSIHEGLSYDVWKAGLQREFEETMKVEGSPGSGNIRGIGAERMVEHNVVDEAGEIQVFQLSAQFPGPTSPRDFITLLITSEFPRNRSSSNKGPRQFMIVSRPCQHPECPPRSGIIRGQYESVEIIREVSSNVLPRKTSELSVSTMAEESKQSKSSSEQNRSLVESLTGPSPAVEWIMITRSDPGGSVPRFMVDKGTPPGIVGDAGKFIKWITTEASKRPSSIAGDEEERAGREDHMLEPPEASKVASEPERPPVVENLAREQPETEIDGIANRNGLYNIITGAVGAASYALATGLRRHFESSFDSNGSQDDSSTTSAAEDNASIATPSETSSLHSFTSAVEKHRGQDKSEGSAAGSRSEESKSQTNQSHEKELKKLQERRRKLEEKAVKMQARLLQKRQGDEEKDAAALAKVREKHEKELAKQDAKYRRELKKLEDRRDREERRAEERRRKTVDREEKANLSLELERTRAERDVALKQIQLLQSQVGQLQSQNTQLAAKLGKLAVTDGPDVVSSVNASSMVRGDSKESSALDL